MDKQTTPILTKSARSGGNYTELREKPFNAVTIAALQETSDIMNGKKKVKWNRFQPGETKIEAKEKMKDIIDS